MQVFKVLINQPAMSMFLCRTGRLVTKESLSRDGTAREAGSRLPGNGEKHAAVNVSVDYRRFHGRLSAQTASGRSIIQSGVDASLSVSAGAWMPVALCSGRNITIHRNKLPV